MSRYRVRFNRRRWRVLAKSPLAAAVCALRSRTPRFLGELIEVELPNGVLTYIAAKQVVRKAGMASR